MRVLSNEPKFNADLGIPYREVVGEHEGTQVQVHIDEFGYHAKAGEMVAANLDEVGLIKFIYFLFGKGGDAE